MIPEFPIPTKVRNYIIQLAQTGTAVPIPKIFQNTLDGTPVWTRISAGFYRITLPNAFPENKTWIAHSDSDNRFAMYPLTITTMNDSGYQLYWESDSTLLMQVYNSSYANVDLSALLGDGLHISLPEIKVYL